MSLEKEVAELEDRVNQLIVTCRQARLERRRAVAERDRLLAINAELRRRIEGVFERIKLLETQDASTS